MLSRQFSAVARPVSASHLRLPGNSHYDAATGGFWGQSNMIQRREFLAGVVAAGGLAASPAMAKSDGFKNPFAAAKKFFTPTVASPKVPLVIHRQRTNEIWTGEVSARDLREEEQDQLNHLLRDIDAKAITEIDPKLLFLAARLQDQLGAPHLLVISAYRTPRSNRRKGGARDSYHTKGMALDVRVSGMGSATIGRTARAVGAGGVGTYRRGFAHFDTGPKRSWRG
jgi:uncharacterized protein YcbK (DUF882 family)